MLRPKQDVLVLTSTFPRWPHDTVPPFVYELSKRLSFRFNIISLSPHDVGAKSHELRDGITIRRFRYFWPDARQTLAYRGGILPNLKQNPWLWIQGITLVACEWVASIQLIRKHAIRLIHAHWIIPQGIVAYVHHLLYGIPYIITVHGGDVYGLKSPMLQRLKRSILMNAEKIIVVSGDIKKHVEHLTNHSISVEIIPMGVDSTAFSPRKRDDALRALYHIDGPMVLFVGRLAEKKGVRFLLDAMKRVLISHPRTTLVIIGEGPEETALKQHADALGIASCVQFLGAIANEKLPVFYATADMFIGPSIQTSDGDTEGLGLTFVEAGLSGCIPVGTTVGGIRDVITDGVNGFIVPQQDADAIARVVVTVLSNKKLVKKIQEHLPEISQTFDWDVITRRYATLYEDVLRSKP